MTSSPNFQISSISDNKLSTIFSKELDIFGLKIYATSATSDDDIVHAGKIFAEYLDNDEDGEVDDQEVLTSLKNENASLIMFEDEGELERTDLDILDEVNGNFQDLYGIETNPNGAALNEFDASLEEILHLISDNGYSQVYPDAFSTKDTSLLTEAMDIARGGKFLRTPNSYPSEAWYTYYDETCDYSCQATEYFYWGLTSILGAQSFPGRYETIQDEWQLNTREKVQETDAQLYALLTDEKYFLPTKIPDGDYTLNIEENNLDDQSNINLNTKIIKQITNTINSSKQTYSKHSSEFKFYNLGDNRYAIKTDYGYEEITGVSTLDFTDQDLSLTTDIKSTFDQVTGKDNHTGKMFRLYNAAFGRFPDSSGLEYWIEQNGSGVNSDRQVAESFLVSDEFNATYGENISNETYVETLYLNILAREYDQEGYEYWLGQLNNGQENRGELLLGFAESDENKALFSEMTGFY
tara:strand:+ start:1349 stop:2749 length:1401 start_codon:yes stop_codon:yes gene_type:complete